MIIEAGDTLGLVRAECGVDIIEVERIQRVVERWGGRFFRHVYTPKELDYCRGRIPELAVRFAAKEAISKALGTGMRGVRWCDIEILPDRRGKPLVYLHAQARRRSEQMGVTSWAVSLSHSRTMATAFAVALRAEGGFAQRAGLIDPWQRDDTGAPGVSEFAIGNDAGKV